MQTLNELSQSLADRLITDGSCTEESLMQLAESRGWQREATKVHKVVEIVRNWVKQGIVEVVQSPSGTEFVLKDIVSLVHENKLSAVEIETTITLTRGGKQVSTKSRTVDVSTNTAHVEDYIEYAGEQMANFSGQLSEKLRKLEAEEFAKTKAAPPEERCPESLGSQALWELIEGPDLWELQDQGDNERTCKFCGSTHPEDFMVLLKQVVDPNSSARADLNDARTRIHFASPSTGVRRKLYLSHIAAGHESQINDALAATRVKDDKLRQTIRRLRRAFGEEKED